MRLNYSLKFGGINGLVVGEGVSLEANDEIEERLDIGLRCWRMRSDAENVEAARGQLGLKSRGRLASTHVGRDFCLCLSALPRPHVVFPIRDPPSVSNMHIL